MNPSTNSLTINIERLPVNTRLGALPLEKSVAQDFDVSLKFSFPYDGSDDLDKTINYADVCSLIIDQMKRGGNLIEHAAWSILRALREAYPQVTAATVTVAKLAPPLHISPAITSATLSWPPLAH